MISAEELLLQRAADLAARAEKGELTYTPFLTPGEQVKLIRYLEHIAAPFVLWGGYAAAERRRAYLLPPYLAEMEETLKAELLHDCYAESALALEVRGSGYRELTHRDFLGALLHLGVERDRLGDICVVAPDRAIFFCDRVMAAFFAEHLERVASDAVRLQSIELPTDFDGGRKLQPVSDTVASPRADAVVAALANLSRDKAQALFREGRVELDYEPTERTDRTVTAGTVIVIRGCGKFIIRSVSDMTRKGRYRLLADRYV